MVQWWMWYNQWFIVVSCVLHGLIKIHVSIWVKVHMPKWCETLWRISMNLKDKYEQNLGSVVASPSSYTICISVWILRETCKSWSDWQNVIACQRLILLIHHLSIEFLSKFIPPHLWHYFGRCISVWILPGTFVCIIMRKCHYVRKQHKMNLVSDTA